MLPLSEGIKNSYRQGMIISIQKPHQLQLVYKVLPLSKGIRNLYRKGMIISIQKTQIGMPFKETPINK
jgi:hypothetical protein